MISSALSLDKDERPVMFLTRNQKQGEMMLSSWDVTAHSGND